MLRLQVELSMSSLPTFLLVQSQDFVLGDCSETSPLTRAVGNAKISKLINTNQNSRFLDRSKN